VVFSGVRIASILPSPTLGRYPDFVKETPPLGSEYHNPNRPPRSLPQPKPGVNRPKNDVQTNRAIYTSFTERPARSSPYTVKREAIVGVQRKAISQSLDKQASNRDRAIPSRWSTLMTVVTTSQRVEYRLRQCSCKTRVGKNLVHSFVTNGNIFDALELEWPQSPVSEWPTPVAWHSRRQPCRSRPLPTLGQGPSKRTGAAPAPFRRAYYFFEFFDGAPAGRLFQRAQASAR